MKKTKPETSASSQERSTREGVFDRLFAHRWITMIVSLLMAILLWLIVLAQEPTQTIIVTGVPVSYDYNAPLYTGASLDISESRDVRINVTITCDTNARGNIDKSDIIVYPDYTSVSASGQPGLYSLPLRARRSDASLQKFEVDSVSPSYVDITFAKIDTRKFAVEVDANVDAADGYVLDTAQVSPNEVTLRGPVEELDRIARVRARLEGSAPLENTLLGSAPLDFLDAQGRVVEADRVTVQEGEQAEVTVPVLRLRTVPLSFEFSNVPSGYDTAALGADLSPGAIRVAGPKETVDALESINAGIINLTRIRIDSADPLRISLPEGLRISLPEGLVNYDNITEASVNFHTSGYDAPRTLTVGDIRVVNVPSGVTVSAITEELADVQLIGRPSELAGLSAADVVALVDASTQNITISGSGQQQFNAQIVVTGTDSVLAVGTYPVLCDVTVQSNDSNS